MAVLGGTAASVSGVKLLVAAEGTQKTESGTRRDGPSAEGRGKVQQVRERDQGVQGPQDRRSRPPA